MTRLQIDLPDEVADELERRAAEAGLTVVEYLGQLVEDEQHEKWPDGFFEEVAGGWRGDALERPEQGEYERRKEL